MTHSWTSHTSSLGGSDLQPPSALAAGRLSAAPQHSWAVSAFQQLLQQDFKVLESPWRRGIGDTSFPPHQWALQHFHSVWMSYNPCWDEATTAAHPNGCH